MGPVLELTTWPPGDWGPVQELAQPPGLQSSATRSSVSTILLLLPVFFLRPASRPVPERQPARYYSDGVQCWNTVGPTDQSALGESRLGLILHQAGGGGGGGTGGTPSHSATLLDTPSATLMAATLRNW